MKCNVDFFIAWNGSDALRATVAAIATTDIVQNVFLLCHPGTSDDTLPEKCNLLPVESLTSSKTLRAISRRVEARYAALFLKPTLFVPAYRCVERLVAAAEDTGALLTYSDRSERRGEVTEEHPVIDYQEGSLRDDFDFGGLLLIRSEALKHFMESEVSARYRHAAFYALRLFLSREGAIFHLNENLYIETETDLRKSGERQFDYVSPSARDVQLESERACTEHLKLIGAWLAPDEFDDLPTDTTTYPVEASVIIPVRNRVRTLADAVHSALGQEAGFDFNVIVVDNHSDDGTSELLDSLSAEDGRVVVLRPERTDLGIGGCWDMAVRHPRCGRYAVQLDSDDLYSGNDTLARIVAAFGKQRAAMVIGSYRMVDFDLFILPPGLIAHREWTPDNGRNNALRINGLGAPRAFRTDLLRLIGFPNTSYGEDYALGLAFSRHFRIGRIYEELYLCRRWRGNSDAALSVEHVNRNNLYKDRLRTLEIMARREMIRRWNHSVGQEEVLAFIARQMKCWPEVCRRFSELASIQTRKLLLEDCELAVQYNPQRITSTAAKIDKKNLKKRPCFLCARHRPQEQISLAVEGRCTLLVNPFPILPNHLTIPTRRHTPQLLSTVLGPLGRLAWSMPDFLLFYNGGRCGASAPDHAHLQAGAKGIVPLERDWKFYANRLEKIYPLTAVEEAELEERGYNTMNVGLYRLHGYACPAFVLLGGQAEGDFHLFMKLISALPKEKGQSEPDFNLLAWRQDGGPAEDDSMIMVLFPRRKHRPECYYAEGKSQYTISPGALDMGGLIITPRQEDFERITPRTAAAILREVTFTDAQMEQVARKLHDGKNARGEREEEEKDFRLNTEPEVNVGIMQASRICFRLNGRFSAKGDNVKGEQTVECSGGGILWNGNLYSELTFHPDSNECSFTLRDVPIGRGFHWERNEEQTFRGVLRLIVDEERVIAINRLPVEEYLVSVISSEMRSTSSVELLKAHAVVSRSWLFYQMKHHHEHSARGGSFFSFVRREDEYIRWYDREEHALFDVCADDHCQRYQGITRADSPLVREAVDSTRGMVITHDGELCDARFSKCCGGSTELHSTCWQETDQPYLVAISDTPEAPKADLSAEADAEAWIRSAPDAFCNTNDKALLQQVLNEYDTSTEDFYRWKVSYSQEELAALIREKREEDFGGIVDLIPVERGKGGRIKRLRIVGTKKTLTIGKELEIRRTLSTSHLYSAAFVVDKEGNANGLPRRFTLTGAGWGHGVGLCQIGAAVMSSKGYAYKQILLHYYTGAVVEKLYS